MVTLVGTQEKLLDALQNLIELDYDAVEAYEAAINRLKNPNYKSQLETFCADHRRHISELSSIVTNHGLTPKDGPSAKQWLTKGKAVLANLFGDEAILRAMLSNEEDTYAAYETMNRRNDIEEIRDMLTRGWEDERTHKTWLETTIESAAHSSQ